MENTEMTIEGSTATWVMPRTDGELGGTYTGSFQFRCYLNPIQILQAGREYREFLGSLGAQASITEGHLAYALSQLKYRILKAPPFWTSTLQESGIQGNIGDLNVILVILDAAMDAEKIFKENAAKERESLLDRAIAAGEQRLAEQNKV
jgi:hypothetical protein